jgi:hypothetical protein
MGLGWKCILPISLANIVLTGILLAAGQGNKRRRGAGHDFHRDAGLDRGANQPFAGIAYAGQAGIGYQGDIFALFELKQKFRRPFRLAELVVAHQRPANLEPGEKLSRVARVFRGDAIGFAQGAQRPRRDILQVSNGRGHDVKLSRHPPLMNRTTACGKNRD